MNTKTLILLAGLFALTLSAAVGPRAAQASGFADYRNGMNGLVAEADLWNADLNTFAAALATKPELACSAEYTDLLHRGRSITADLVGTSLLAPQALAGTHGRAIAGMTQAVAGAELIGTTCNGSTLGAGLAQVQQGQTEFTRGSLRIRNFIHGFGRSN